MLKTYRGDGLNLYAYCGNNPVMYYDPSGYSSLSKENPFALEDERPEGGAAGDNSGNRLKGGSEPDTKHKNTTTLWDIKTNATDKINYNISGAKVSAYKEPNTGLYWARDTEGHGESAFKVFKMTKGGKQLGWVADADEYGNYIIGKHKGDTGLVIKVK